MVHAHEEPRRKAERPSTPPARVNPQEQILQLQEAVGNDAVTAMVNGVLKSPGKPLDEAVRQDMERRLGADFSDVRLHTGGTAERSATVLGARAYTSGSHVVVGHGGADPHTLAHELTHVIQQRQGPVAGTDNGQGLAVSHPSDSFEREAEHTATLAMHGTAPAVLHTAEPAGAAPVVQRFTTAEGTGQLKNVYVSENEKYLVQRAPTDKNKAEIFVRSDAPVPRYCERADTASRAVMFKEQRYFKYVPKTAFPQDCLHAAEEIMHQLPLDYGQSASKVARTDEPFSVSEDREDNVALAQAYAEQRATDKKERIEAGARPNDLEAPQPGEAYAIVETQYETDEVREGRKKRKVRVPGNELQYPYHAAAVVAEDGGDRITLEALAGTIDAEELQPAAGTFHMYDTDPTKADGEQQTFHSRWEKHFSDGAITITLKPHGEGLKTVARAKS